MKGLWRTYVLGNVHISLCAVFFCWAGYQLHNVTINPWILVFLFTGSLCTYTLHRILSAHKLRSPVVGHERFEFIETIGQWKIVYLSVLVLISLWSFSMLTQQTRLYLAILSALSIGYIIPILGSDKRLRDVSLIKIFLVAFVWAGIFLTSYAETPQFERNSKLVLLFFEKFLFIFALTLPFDIRDRELDSMTQVSTFGNLLSIKQIKILIVALITACCILTIALYCLSVYSISLMIALVFFYSLQGFLSLIVSSRTREMYYLGVLDGLIILQSLIIFFFKDV